MLADAEYEANRARGIATPPPLASAFPSPQSALPLDTSGPVYGEIRDVWHKPRAVPLPEEPPGPPPTPAAPPVVPVLRAISPRGDGTVPGATIAGASNEPVAPLRGLPTPVPPPPAAPVDATPYTAVFQKPTGPIRFKIGGEKSPTTSDVTNDGED